MPITRRTLLGLLSSSTFFLTASSTAVFAADVPVSAPALDYPQGVASADPQAHAVMLWTRAVPRKENREPQHLLVQLSTSADFSEVLLQSAVHTSAESDYTVRAYIDGLKPDTSYYYRFVAGGNSYSRTGRTRTAPTADKARKINVAFASCQSFEQAHYGSWARMLEEDSKADAKDQIDFVLHLGDFIYERSWNTRYDGSEQSRYVPPFPDGVDTDKNRYAVSLADYRHLYKTYLSDPHLQAARARWPFVCTWDDHEFGNNNFQGYSNYSGQPKPDPQRKQWANQAWFEYVPAVLDELEEQPAHSFQPGAIPEDESAANEIAVNSLKIYRKLNWGQNLDLLLTDSRSYRSPAALPPRFAATLDLPMNPIELVKMADEGREYNNGSPPAMLPYGDGTTPNPGKDRAPGSILGLEQRDWFISSLKTSQARWKLWGNALPLIPMHLDMSSLPFTDFEDSVFNLDAWAGYPHEVNYLMTALEAEQITGLVSFSGDHHMHGAGTISRSAADSTAKPVAVDFTVAGISSSPIFEDVLNVAKTVNPDFAPLVFREVEGKSGTELEPVWNMTLMDGVLAAYTYSQAGLSSIAQWLGPNNANPGLKYVDTTANGYGLGSFEAKKLTVQLITMTDCQPDFQVAPEIHCVTSFTLPHWSAGEVPKLVGPQFEGGIPFPFDITSV
ncbi:MAG: alkaline phosphatase D [Halioglobus sp.]|jgi:alkaline phosphatase D